MPSYGTWIQAPDYAASGFESVFPDETVPDAGYASQDIPGSADGVPQATGVDVLAVQDAARTDTSLVTQSSLPTVSGPNSGALRYGTDYMGGIFGPWTTRLRAYHLFGPRSVSPYTNGRCLWVPTMIDIPPDAIGWQWQSDLSEGGAKPSETLSAEMDVILTGDQLDNSTDPATTIDGEFVTNFIACGAEFESDTSGPFVSGSTDDLLAWDGPADASLILAVPGPGLQETVVTLDLTDHLDSQGRVCVAHQLAAATVVPQDLSTDEAGVGYGYGAASDECRWTFRPPMFRWIFDTVAPVPPWRLFPRDDHLRNNARLHPAPATRQQRARIFPADW